MKFTIAREEEFVPKWNENDKAEEPIKFILKNLNTVEREGLTSVDFSDDGKPHIKIDFIRACRIGIRKIENLIVENKAIEKAQDFLDCPVPGFSELAREVGSHVVAANAPQTEDERKNLQ